MDANCITAAVSWAGVDGLGDGGVAGRLLSAEIALFGANADDTTDVLVVLGEGQRLGPEPADGLGDLYLEGTSRVLDRRVVSFFLSATPAGDLEDSIVECLCDIRSRSHASIQILSTKPKCYRIPYIQCLLITPHIQ